MIALLLIFTIQLTTSLNKNNQEKNAVKISYNDFMTQVNEGKVKSVSITEQSRGPNQLKVTAKDGKSFTISGPTDAKLVDKLLEKNIQVYSIPEETPGLLMTLLISWGPMLLLIGVWIWFMRRSAGGGKGIFSMNKSKAQLIDPDKINVTFSDVVGCDEAKIEAQEFVDFLKNPDKYTKLGGKIPRGLLLTGSAGTGKTLLAKAIAKESGVPFFATSGSEFVEMFVGLGASRVRDMFENAKKIAPCVIFIDEIDAIGGKRSGGNGFSGGHDEREQTLNQILVELDGMDTNKGVILIGATNRPDVLDPALLRPGRFDRQIIVQLPDVNGREEILKIHSKETPLGKDVDLSRIARGTTGFSGAELANLINEATMFAARRNKKFVEQKELQDAADKIMMGVERPSLAMNVEDKRKTAYHEAGHAVIAKLMPTADPVHKVTIIPRGRALGVTIQLPTQDRWSYQKDYLTDRIAILMGGRAAEEVFCNTWTNGASNDIAVATNMVRSMITEWGMSDLGPVAYGDKISGGFLGGGQLDMRNLAPSTLEKVDALVTQTLKDQYKRAVDLLKENQDRVHKMVEALMEVETIDEWHIENIMRDRRFDDPQGLREYQDHQDQIAIAAGKFKKNDPSFVPGNVGIGQGIDTINPLV